MLTISAKYLLVNASGEPVQAAQPGTGAVWQLQPDCVAPFHWADASQRFELCLRPALGSWTWSGAFKVRNPVTTGIISPLADYNRNTSSFVQCGLISHMSLPAYLAQQQSYTALQCLRRMLKGILCAGGTWPNPARLLEILLNPHDFWWCAQISHEASFGARVYDALHGAHRILPLSVSVQGQRCRLVVGRFEHELPPYRIENRCFSGPEFSAQCRHSLIWTCSHVSARLCIFIS